MSTKTPRKPPRCDATQRRHLYDRIADHYRDLAHAIDGKRPPEPEAVKQARKTIRAWEADMHRKLTRIRKQLDKRRAAAREAVLFHPPEEALARCKAFEAYSLPEADHA